MLAGFQGSTETNGGKKYNKVFPGSGASRPGKRVENAVSP